MPLTASIALAIIPFPSAFVPRFVAVERERLADEAFLELVPAFVLADDLVDPLAKAFVFDAVDPDLDDGVDLPALLLFVDGLVEADPLADLDADVFFAAADFAFGPEDFDFEPDDFEAPDLDPEDLDEVVLLPDVFDEPDREVEDFLVAGILFPPYSNTF